MPPNASGWTDEQMRNQVRAQFLHEVELVFCSIKGALPMRFGESFKIPEGLEQRDLQTVVPDHVPDITGTSIVGDEILFKYLNAIKPGGRNGREFLPVIPRRWKR